MEVNNDLSIPLKEVFSDWYYNEHEKGDSKDYARLFDVFKMGYEQGMTDAHAEELLG